MGGGAPAPAAAPDRPQRRDGIDSLRAEHHSRVLPLEPPEHLKKAFRAGMLAQLGSDTLDIFELELFDWYTRETEAVLGAMSAGEHAYIQEQINAGTLDINDSGAVAVDYYAKRLRYSHVIYLTSLLETCLERACATLTTALGKDAVPFGPDELMGDQWSTKLKFLERYGHFEIPGTSGRRSECSFRFVTIWCMTMETLPTSRTVTARHSRADPDST